MSFQSASGPAGFRVAERKWPVVKQRKYQGILIEQISLFTSHQEELQRPRPPRRQCAAGPSVTSTCGRPIQEDAGAKTNTAQEGMAPAGEARRDSSRGGPRSPGTDSPPGGKETLRVQHGKDLSGQARVAGAALPWPSQRSSHLRNQGRGPTLPEA